MRKSFKLSTIAIIAAMLTTLPASAVSINLAGNGNGGLLGGLLGNGSGNDNTTASVNVNTGTGVGTDSGNSLLSGLFGDGTSGIPPVTADVDLNGLLNGSGPTTANFNLGGSGGTDANAALDLFGDGDGPAAAVNLGAGNSALPGGPGLDGGADNVILDLFGKGGGGNGGDGGDDGNTGGLFGNVRVASLDDTNLACFTPNARQVAKLVNRHSYTQASMTGWAGVSAIKIVQVNLCDEARLKLSASLSGMANINRLQDFIDAHPGIRSGIAAQGHSAGDVVAVDRSGSTLVVYVI